MKCVAPLTLASGITVPCGKCNLCAEQRRNEWTFRITQETLISKSVYFLTITYEDEHLSYNQSSGLSELSKRDLQLFKKRLRKEQSSLDPAVRLRYYTVGEYGGLTGRPHYHSILFNLAESIVPYVGDLWGLGTVHVLPVNPARIHYVTKYHVNKLSSGPGRAPPFALMSRRPGLGINYVNTHFKYHKDALRNFTKVNGMAGRLPRFYKLKIFTEDEREQIALIAYEKMRVAFVDEIARLSKLHPEPYAYWAERVRNANNLVIHKLNQNDKF